MAKDEGKNYLREAQRLIIRHPKDAAIVLVVTRNPGSTEERLYELGCDLRRLRRMSREQVLIFESGGGYYPITAAKA